MPSVKMEKSLTSGWMKEKSDLQVYQMVEDIVNCTPSNNDDFREHWGGTNHDMMAQISLEKLYTEPDNLEYRSSMCSSNIGIFSSLVMESVDFYKNQEKDVTCVSNLDTEEIPDCTKSSCEIQASNVKVLDYMALPFLEDVLDPVRHVEEIFLEANNSNLYPENQLRSNSQNACPNIEHDIFDPQMYIEMQPVRNEKLNGKQITLVLDLDETLVHSTLNGSLDADFRFNILYHKKQNVMYMKKRPHLHTFLNRVSEMFEIIVFTASQSFYANQILDTLDPDGTIISRRAYRDSCVFYNGTYLKDLSIFGINLAKIAIVDNSPKAFKFQVNNGIPIESWFNDPSDTALLSLLPFLETLVNVEDVRPIIVKKFGNKEK